MKLNPVHRKNLDTIIRAARAGHLAVLDARRRSDGANVALLVAVGRDGAAYTMTPFAEMVAGNPFELYAPPDPDGGPGYLASAPPAP